MAVVLISGGSGLVGTNLTRHLIERNFKVIILTRKKNKPSHHPNISYSYWNIQNKIIDTEALKKADHIIHLAGAGVMDKKWTDDYKKTIVNSRTKSANLIIKALKETAHKVKTFISASAIGYYGPDPHILTNKDGFAESDLPSNDFLGETCVLWEAASEPVKSMGIRRVVFRFGIVLANEGGALKEYKMPLKFGLATIFGSGKQMMSWIHQDDLSRMICEGIENDYISGVYNAVAPEPVLQKKFMTILGEKMRDKFFIPLHVPSFMLKLILGQRSIELLKSATVSGKKIKATGFTFLYPSVRSALDELTKK
ncbi:MAG: TIGR01777 family oxidoreductase [Ginsengibacter sp.]